MQRIGDDTHRENTFRIGEGAEILRCVARAGRSIPLGPLLLEAARELRHELTVVAQWLDKHDAQRAAQRLISAEHVGPPGTANTKKHCIRERH